MSLPPTKGSLSTPKKEASASAIPSSSPVGEAEGQPSPAEAKKIATLEAKIANLKQQIRETEEKQKEVDSKLRTKDPQALVKKHIRLLHDYNEIRDIGQGLMGMIADQRGVRVVDIYKEFDVAEGD